MKRGTKRMGVIKSVNSVFRRNVVYIRNITTDCGLGMSITCYFLYYLAHLHRVGLISIPTGGFVAAASLSHRAKIPGGVQLRFAAGSPL